MVGLENKIKDSVEKCFFEVKQSAIFTSRPLLPPIKKDVLPALFSSNVVYNFSCHYDSRYIGRTSQRLLDRICQHVPKCIRTGQILNSRNISTRSGKSSKPVMFSESAIGQHLLDYPICAENYSEEKFPVFYPVVRFYIKSRLHQTMQAKFMSPKEFAYNLKLLP